LLRRTITLAAACSLAVSGCAAEDREPLGVPVHIQFEDDSNIDHDAFFTVKQLQVSEGDDLCTNPAATPSEYGHWLIADIQVENTGGDSLFFAAWSFRVNDREGKNEVWGDDPGTVCVQQAKVDGGVNVYPGESRLIRLGFDVPDDRGTLTYEPSGVEEAVTWSYPGDVA